MLNVDFTQLKTSIEGASRVVLCCHKSPDGDALSSMIAWAMFLDGVLSTNENREITMVAPDAFPDFLRWLPSIEKVVRYDKHKEEVEKKFAEADLIFCLDFNVSSRVGEMQETLDKAQGRKVMIDHHLNPVMENALIISEPESSSTAELVFRLIEGLGGADQIDKKCASVIYCGMMTDTGGFVYNSNRAVIYEIISKLMKKGINKDKIYRNVYNNYSQWAIRLRGYVLCHKMNVFPDCHASYFTISKQDMQNFHFMKGDAEGLVNEPLRIKGMRLSISLREDDRHDNVVWVSLRSVDDLRCDLLAARFFNGGGHANASGGRLNCSLEEAEQVARKAIESLKETK